MLSFTIVVLIAIGFLAMLASTAWFLPGFWINWRRKVRISDFPEAYRPHQKMLLEPAECLRVSQGLARLKDKVVHHRGPLYTLGTASYIIAAGKGRKTYEKEAAMSNVWMRQEFGWLYDKVRDFFEQELQLPVEYREQDAALPGFHLFKEDRFMRYPVASLHLDRQQYQLEWPPEADLERGVLSWTLSIQLPPSNDAGLWVWQARKGDLPGNPIWPPLPWKMRNVPKTKVTYEPGMMVWHDGNQYHMISPQPNTKLGQWRITLQGHGVRIGQPEDPNAKWVFYW